ncbi:uncharacterized protein LOC112877561 isoform X2 [Panicum hallii]|nr:uncharacterized protein LOC112877561 isoform X2 [Panicum hallii]
MMYPTGPQHHGPRKCYTPRCRNHHSPLTTRSGDGATAPAEGKTTSRRAVSPSARGQRRGCSGMGAAKVRPPRRKPASREGPSRSNLDSLKSRQRLVWNAPCNPITSEQITLPLEIAMEQAGEVHLLMVQVKIISIIAQFTSDGQLLNGCLNLALGKLWLGDENWSRLPSQAHFQDCSYKDGLLYGEIIAINLSSTMVTTRDKG